MAVIKGGTASKSSFAISKGVAFDRKGDKMRRTSGAVKSKLILQERILMNIDKSKIKKIVLAYSGGRILP